MTKSTAHTLPCFCVAFYLLAVACVLMGVLRATGGHFIYALDDPYIHLALSEQIAHGHYGINAAEYSSPSSSVLWPFLLVPFAGTPLHTYVPLAWNLVSGVLASALLGSGVARWLQPAGRSASAAWWQQALLCVVLIFLANLPSLAMLGMEHGIQVLLAICCAIGMAEALDGRQMPAWCLAAAVLAPAIRYEDLALTLAVCCALCGLDQARKAAAVLTASLLPLIGFSVFLHSHGMSLLPTSVMVKSHAYANANASALQTVVDLVVVGLYQAIMDPQRYPVLAFFLVFAALTWHAKSRPRHFVFGGAALLAGLQLVAGRFGWFHRYEDYAVIFLAVLCVRVLAERPRLLFPYGVAGLAACASTYVVAAVQTPTVARATYEQQYQMHRFIAEFYRKDVAVNDVGLVSYARPPGIYVLDVYGLASQEAARHTDKSAAWLKALLKRRAIDLAILYPGWFHVPPAWNPLAEMCVDVPLIMLGGKCVVLYSTEPQADALIEAELQRFATTLPAGVGFRLQPTVSDTRKTGSLH